MLELGTREEPHDLERTVARGAHPMGSKRRDDGERARADLGLLVTDDGDALAVKNEEDLLGAVRVRAQVLPWLDLEIDDGRGVGASGYALQGRRRSTSR